MVYVALAEYFSEGRQGPLYVGYSLKNALHAIADDACTNWVVQCWEDEALKEEIKK